MMTVAENYSVTAEIRAVDQGFSSTFNRCAGTTESFGGRLKKALGLGAAMAVGMKAVGAATSTLSSHIGDAISRYDQLNNFPKVMSNLGISTKAAEKSAKRLSDGLTGLPTTLDSATSGVTRFTSKNGNIKKSTDYFLALNNAVLAGGASTEIQSSALEQLSQSYSKGKMDLMEWRAVQTAMPAQLNQIAKSMGMTADELGAGLRDGSISMDDFMGQIVKLNKKGVGGFASFSQQAKTATGGIKTAITNMNTTITRGMANGMSAIDEALKKNDLPTIGQMINKVGKKIGDGFTSASNAIKKANIKGVIAGITPWVNGLKGAVKGIGSVIRPITGFINKHAEAITKAAPAVLMLVGAYKGFKTVSGFIGPVKMFTGSISTMAGKLTAKLPQRLLETAAGEKATGAASKTSCKSVLSAAAAFVALGVGIALAGLGFSLIANSAIALASSGGAAVAICAGLILAFAGLAAGASVLGPALTAGAVGMLAFGAAVLMVGAGVYLASSGLAKLAATLPTIAVYGGAAAVGMIKLSTGLIAFAAGAVAAGAAGVGLAAGMVVAGAGCLAASAGFLVAAGGLLLMKAGAKAVLSSVKSIAGSAKAAGASVKTMTSSISIASSGLNALKAKASGAMGSLKSAFKSGFSSAVTTTKTQINAIQNAVSGLSGKMKTLGQHAGQGLANGLKSKRGEVYSAAKSLARAAEKGGSITLKIHSPSRVFKKMGQRVGEGFAIGISDMKAHVANATQNMMAVPDMAMAGGGSLGISEDYYRSSTYTIEVPVNLDAREIARVTAPYAEEEQTKRSTRSSRSKGVR